MELLNSRTIVDIISLCAQIQEYRGCMSVMHELREYRGCMKLHDHPFSSDHGCCVLVFLDWHTKSAKPEHCSAFAHPVGTNRLTRGIKPRLLIVQ